MLALPWGCQSPAPRPVPVSPREIPQSQIAHLVQAGPYYISGDATPDGLKALKQRGLKTVIDLRLPEQVPAGYEQAVREIGLNYVLVPMQSHSMSPEQAEAVLAAIDAHADQPLLLECKSGNRSGAAYGLYMGVRKQCTVEASLRLARAAGMSNDKLAADLRAYLERQR